MATYHVTWAGGLAKEANENIPDYVRKMWDKSNPNEKHKMVSEADGYIII